MWNEYNQKFSVDRISEEKDFRSYELSLWNYTKSHQYLQKATGSWQTIAFFDNLLNFLQKIAFVHVFMTCLTFQ